MFCYAWGYNDRKMYLMLDNTEYYVYNEMYLVYRDVEITGIDGEM